MLTAARHSAMFGSIFVRAFLLLGLALLSCYCSWLTEKSHLVLSLSLNYFCIAQALLYLSAPPSSGSPLSRLCYEICLWSRIFFLLSSSFSALFHLGCSFSFCSLPHLLSSIVALIVFFVGSKKTMPNSLLSFFSRFGLTPLSLCFRCMFFLLSLCLSCWRRLKSW